MNRQLMHIKIATMLMFSISLGLAQQPLKSKDAIIPIITKNGLRSYDPLYESIKGHCIIYDSLNAINAINDNMPLLLVVGKLNKSKDDLDFENRFQIQYYSFENVVGIPPLECIKGYNAVIIDYLNQRYGNTWREKVRKEVLY